jgi:hypothetical protein
MTDEMPAWPAAQEAAAATRSGGVAARRVGRLVAVKVMPESLQEGLVAAIVVPD